MQQFKNLEAAMLRAISLAERGVGHVEPNPCVGAVVVDDELRLLGEGWHQQFGGPHAEVNAIADLRRRSTETSKVATGQGATLVCTLEPCAHHGKTPPCVDAVIAAGFRRVVIAVTDPAPHVDGRGIAKLREAGIEVSVGLCAESASRLIAPFVTLMLENRPYVHAKWAMSLDGRIATRTGASQWISSEESRLQAHKLRGRMDAILVGIGTALADNPLLTARPPGPRTPLRIVVDTHGRLPLDAQLVCTAKQVPLLVVCVDPTPTFQNQIQSAGGEVLTLPADSETGRVDIALLMQELGRRRLTNLLIEGGGHILGSFHDRDLIDEYHIDIAPKVLGGKAALSPLLGMGHAMVPPSLEVIETTTINGDTHIHARPPRR
ncbi:MAG: bifunctional diaminohydroxyphosphoribosylaminopyrimidine deaminase/5-amino-6-(5-phosphoribosylamino)uracil reductase RibD [Planctomycetaceae bacterium]